MASIKEISLPHGTIPTQMFGNVNLQNAVMYVNENFAAVKEGVNDAVAATNEAIAEKADGDHDHDDAYSALGHTHSQSEVIGLSSALDGKADLNHEHSQYLSSLPAHYHDVTGIQGLGEQLQAKAEKTHSHTMAQVENLSTELGVKASTAYVDQQVNAVGSTIKTIADQEIIDCGAAKEGTGGEASDDVPEDVEIAPVNEGVSHKNGRVGTKNRWARADHQHVFQTETDETKLSKLKCDGNGTDGAADFGTETIVPRIDHSHPLNFPDDKPVDEMSKDGMGEGGIALFGNTNYYADLGHSHPLNVASSGTPSDVVKSTGTASSGSSEYYARQDHIHKMPALDAEDIAYSSTTVGDEIDELAAEAVDHEGRIAALESAGPGGGTVKKVDNKSPGEDGNVVLNALTTSNYSETLGGVYQAKSDKLDALDDLLNDNGTIPSAAVVDDECASGGECLAYFDSDKALSHLGNDGITVSKANAMNACFDYASTSGKVTSGKLNCKAAGSSTAPASAKVIGFEANASSASLMDVAIVDTGVSATDGTNVAWKGGKLVKDTNTYLKVDSSIGLVHSNAGVISYVGIGDGNNQVAAGNHKHAYGDDSLTGFGTAAAASTNDFAPSSTVSFPGFGPNSNQAARGSHNHNGTYVQGNGTAGDAAYKNVGEDGGVQAYSSKLAKVQSNIDDNGKVLLSGIRGDISDHTGNCLVTINGSGTLGHSGNKAYTLVDDASDTTKNANKIITDKDIGNGLEADSTTHSLKVKCAENGGITADSNGIALGGFGGTDKWVKTDGSGKITTTNDTPITASTAASGVVYNDAGTISYKGIGGESGQVAAGDHTHTASQVTDLGTAAMKNIEDFAPSTTVSFPGYGGNGTADTVSRSDHTHGKITNDGKLVDEDVDTTNRVVVTDGSKNITYNTKLNSNSLGAIQSAFTIGSTPSQVPNYYAKELTLRRMSGGVGSVRSIVLSSGDYPNVYFYGSGNQNEDYGALGIFTRLEEGTEFCFFSRNDVSVSSSKNVEVSATGTGTVCLCANANNSVLKNSPTEGSDATTSKAIATCGWVASNFAASSGLTSSKWVVTDGEGKISTTNDVPATFSSTPTAANLVVMTNGTDGSVKTLAPYVGTGPFAIDVITNVQWLNNQIQMTAKTLTFTNGILTGVANKTITPISTVTYNP